MDVKDAARSAIQECRRDLFRRHAVLRQQVSPVLHPYVRTFQDAGGVVYLTQHPGDGRFARARIAAEYHVQRRHDIREAAFLPLADK